MPLFWIDGSTLRQCTTKRFSERFCERKAIRIQELTVDHERVLLASNDWQSQYQIRQDPAFDAAWIKEHREPTIIRIPEFFGHQKSQFVGFTILINQVNPFPRLPLAHWSGEVDIQPECVAG